MAKEKVFLKIIFIIVSVAIILLIVTYINHQIRLNQESKLRSPLGQIVEVDGHNMSIYIEGTGDTTLVFMSGGGTCSPILDFKSLYSLVSDKYRIAVIEKFGYGFSDIVDKSRDIDSILEDTRAALTAAGLTAPYVLCPHSMSGLEALYWAQKYSNEVSAIIGLDMVVPGYYDSMNINIPLMRIAAWAANIGITRFVPGISDSAEKVNDMGVPQLPMLLFVSDSSGGTGFDKETWREIPIEYIAQVHNGKYIELDCPHYIRDYEYKTISENITGFLSDK